MFQGHVIVQARKHVLSKASDAKHRPLITEQGYEFMGFDQQALNGDGRNDKPDLLVVSDMVANGHNHRLM
jgi:hypothetical protein